MNLKLFQRLDAMISLKSTGPVNVLASKLGISPRQVKYTVKKLRVDGEAPVWFDHKRQSYVYTQEGRCEFKFCADNEKKVIKDSLKNSLSLFALACSFLPNLVEQVAYLPQLF